MRCLVIRRHDGEGGLPVTVRPKAVLGFYLPARQCISHSYSSNTSRDHSISWTKPADNNSGDASTTEFTVHGESPLFL